MKRFILPIAVFFFLVNFTFAAAPPDFCVRVFAQEKDGVSMGSGILVDSNRILTNEHVVRDRTNNDVKILFTDWTIIDGKVLRTDRKWDLALIEIKEVGQKPIVFGIPAVEDSVLCIHGYGLGLPGKSWGIAIQTDPYLVIQGTSARSGDSGGCILNVQGKLVGILFGQTKNHTYGTGITRIIKFLEE